MAINEWKIWQTLGFTKPKKQEKIDIDKDLTAINEFLSKIPRTIKDLQVLFSQFKALRKQELKLRAVHINNPALKKNLTSQIKTYDKILRIYEIFDIDEDISAARAKKIAKSLVRSAEKLKINEKLRHKIKTEERWTYNW